MKKFLIGVVILVAFLVFFAGMAKADDFDIALTTYAVAGQVPGADIAGNIKIDKVILSNSGATAQVVTVYELGASSSTISSRLVIDVPSNAVDGPIILDWPYYNPMKVTDFAIRKSTTATTVNAYVLYR
jgi:hypothetical protein